MSNYMTLLAWMSLLIHASISMLVSLIPISGRGVRTALRLPEYQCSNPERYGQIRLWPNHRETQQSSSCVQNSWDVIAQTELKHYQDDNNSIPYDVHVGYDSVGKGCSKHRISYEYAHLLFDHSLGGHGSRPGKEKWSRDLLPIDHNTVHKSNWYSTFLLLFLLLLLFSSLHDLSRFVLTSKPLLLAQI